MAHTSDHNQHFNDAFAQKLHNDFAVVDPELISVKLGVW